MVRAQAHIDFISNIERGKSAPSFPAIERLAEVLEVPLEEFLSRLINGCAGAGCVVRPMALWPIAQFAAG
jgi:hypothetical protein